MWKKNETHCVHQRFQNAVIKKKSITIYYPHYPYCGKTLPIISTTRKSNPPGYVCEVSENKRLFIPQWVTCPEAKRGCSIKKVPQISFENLLKLSEYLSTERISELFKEDRNGETNAF